MKLAGVPSTECKWENVPVGAMGYNTFIQGIEQSSIKRQIAGTDGAGLFRREVASADDIANTRWTQCFQRGVGVDALFDMKPSVGDSDGTWFAKMAPSNFDRITAHWKHRVVISEDGGLTWAIAAAVPQMEANSNLQTSGSYGRLCYCKGAFDGLDPDVFYWGAEETGLMVTDDWFASYTTHADIAAPTHATTAKRYILVAVDENSAAAANGRNSVVAVVRPGNGLYISTNGGVSFALADATVTDVYNIKFAPDGKLWIMIQGSGQNLKTFTIGGALSALFGPTNDVRDVVWDPADATKVYTSKFFYKSTSPFATWTDIAGAESDPFFVTMVGHEAPLIAEVFNDDHALINNSLDWFDGNLWVSTGYGPVYVDETNLRTAHKTTGPALTMNEDVVGIENIVPQVVHHMPSGRVIVISQDKSAIPIPTNGTYPQYCFPTSALVPGFDIDDNGGTYAAVLAGNGIPGGLNWSGWSDDDGDSWTRFTTAPSAFLGGSICVIRANEIAIVTGNNGWPRWTADNGETWENSVFDGLAEETGSENGWGSQNIQNDRRVICNEKDVNPDRVWAYRYGPLLETAGEGLWESPDGGRNYDLVFNDPIIDPLFAGNHELLEYCEGFLWLSAGEAGGDGGWAAPAATNTLKRCSTADVTVWEAMPLAREVTFYCFGAPLNAGEYPTLYIDGWVNGVRGQYRCRNADAVPIANCVWEKITVHNEFAQLVALSADKRPGHFMELIAGFGGMSYRKCTPDFGITLT